MASKTDPPHPHTATAEHPAGTPAKPGDAAAQHAAPADSDKNKALKARTAALGINPDLAVTSLGEAPSGVHPSSDPDAVPVDPKDYPSPPPPPFVPPPKPKPRHFKALKGAGKPKAVLVSRQTAGGDSDFLVAAVDNSIELLPGMLLTSEEVELLAAAGFDISVHAGLATT